MVIIPVYNVIILPYTRIYLQMDKLKGVAEKELQEGNQVLFLISKKQEEKTLLEMDSFYSIGVMGTLKEINDSGFAIVQTSERVRIEDIHLEKGHIQFGLTKLPDISDIDEKTEKLKLVPEVLKAGVTIFGVTGTYDGTEPSENENTEENT